ncbi:MAG: serine hydrolase domain-containing protein [Acidimicrobiales bacterium]|jgi:CubicO group peptidase (beta-lactamase class C family)
MGALTLDVVEEAFDETSPLAKTFAVLVIQSGEVVLERYADAFYRFDGSSAPLGPETLLPGWSMAKSVLHALVGILVADGALGLESRADVPEWASSDDPRREITLRDLLEMRDGLRFVEDYEDGEKSDVIEMLFGSGKDDVSRFASDRDPVAKRGERFNYSSGTTNIISGMVARKVGRGERYREFMRSWLLDPLEMTSAEPGFDKSGVWVASSFLDATAMDFARFGLLYLNGGRVGGRQVVPEDWIATAYVPRSRDGSDGSYYSVHWWVECDGRETIRCGGYGGQSITVCPSLDLVMVRLGSSPESSYPDLASWRERVLAAF